MREEEGPRHTNQQKTSRATKALIRVHGNRQRSATPDNHTDHKRRSAYRLQYARKEDGSSLQLACK